MTGASGSLKLRLSNTSGSTFNGPVIITLYASADGAVSSDDATVATLTLANVSLKAGSAKAVRLKFNYPAGLTAGSYNLIVSAARRQPGAAPALEVSASRVMISPSTVDLAATFASGQPIAVQPGRNEDVLVKITNDGNVAATGTVGAGAVCLG